MKKFIHPLLLVALVIAVACEGPQGPPGQPGEDGLDGDLFLPTVFEIEGDFLPENDFQLFYEFPNSIEVLESDIVLVYILWEQTENDAGESFDVWRLLPQTIVLPDSTLLQYNFDHTFTDVQIFLDGNTNFDNLLPAEALGQVFRVVVLPANFESIKSLEIDDYNGMMKSLNINPALVEPDVRINLN